jgi:nucleoside-diphosphate-sugar epimerase
MAYPRAVRRVLVTGGHGFVGSHLVEALLARGDRVRCLSRRAGASSSLAGKDVEVVPGDVRDAGAVERGVRGADEVYHLAALTRSLTEREMRAVNVGGTARLLAAALREGLAGRFVLCSSLAASGPSRDGRPRTEDAPCAPVTWYGRSKLEAERIVLAAADRLPVTVARPPSVYGPRERDLLAIFRAVARGFAPRMEPSPRTISLVYATDLAEGLVALAGSPDARGGTFFLAHEETIAPEALTAAIARALGRAGRPLRIAPGVVGLLGRLAELGSQLTGAPALLSRQRLVDLREEHWTCSPERAFRVVGWRARTSLADGLARTAAWYREHGWLPRSVPSAAPTRSR